ncbi:hypothetical protein M9Y10_005601 [Tritrichomonas musculus]|uniref:Fungal lipase-type domain-containing protein n=1 Tax=Tritrichomonas musculus TaxID=1915356 RepID=A0ABR2JCK3_9EUKA
MKNQEYKTSRYQLLDPIDFILEPSHLSTISCGSIQSDFEFIVDERSYKCNKTIARTVFSNVNIQLSQHPETDKIFIKITDPNCYFQLIQSMMAGEYITINENNAFFLNYIASTLGNEELRSKTEIFMSRYKVNTVNINNNDNNNYAAECEYMPAKWYQVLLKLILNFFAKISIIFKIFLFLCELIGLAIGVAYIFNLFMIPLTSGIISLNMKNVYRYGVMIPYFLFNINIVSLVEIVFFYICKSNHFISKIPFSKHIQLIKLIRAVWPFCNKKAPVKFKTFQLSTSPLINSTQTENHQEEYMNNDNENNNKTKKKRKFKALFFSGENNMYNTILGFLLIVLCILFCFRNVFRFVIILFTVFIPSILIRTLFFLYSFLAILSIFPKGRSNFIEYGDFSDPFVNSIYFTESKWILFFYELFSYCKCINKNTNHNQADSGSTSISNIKDHEFLEDENQDNVSTFPFCFLKKCNPLFISFLQALFSKPTAGYLVSFGIFILLIDEWRKFNIFQIYLIIFVIILSFNTLMCSINFPFLTIQRFFTPPCSERQVQFQNKWMNNSRKRIKWNNLWFTWSKDATSIRVSRIIFIVFFSFAVVGSIFPASIFRQEELVTPKNHKNLNLKHKNNESLIYLMNPVCDLRIRDLTITQLSAIAESSYQLDDDDPTLDSMLKAFFGNNWNESLKIVNDAPKSETSHSNIRHFIYKDNLHLISIRGTDNTVDVLADIELWASSLMMNILSSSIPIFNGYASEFRTFLGYLMHLPSYMFQPFSLINSYIEIINKFVSSIQLGNGTEIVLTGHSLGGGLAKLVSVMTGYKAVSYSGPGIQAITAFYEWKDNNIGQSFINVVPNLDPVAGVDQSTGSSFLIPCNEGLIACHSIIRTMCMLATICTDSLNNQTYSFCLDNLGEKSMNEMTSIGRPYSYLS